MIKIKMKRLFWAALICLLLGCTPKSIDNGVNLVVMEKGDTLSYFNYTNDNLENFDLFTDKTDLDSVIGNKKAQAKLIGKFAFGFRDKRRPINRLLGFEGVPIEKFKVTGIAEMPFLDEEFNLTQKYDVKLITNYIDSLLQQVRKNEAQIAIDKASGDTLVYQECAYMFRMPEKEELVLTILIYDNRSKKKEMLELLNDFKEKIDRYSTKPSVSVNAEH